MPGKKKGKFMQTPHVRRSTQTLRRKPKSERRGLFIVIEGGVGSGKSTLFNKLKRKYKTWSFYREPGSTPFGERVRKAVQGLYHYPVDKYAALFAYNAARANLIRSKVIPGLEEGKNVVLNRYWFSTYAYQGSMGIDKKIILDVCKIASNSLLPDVTIHLDQDPKVGMRRKAGMKDTDRYDLEKIGFHRRIRKNYLELAKLYKSNWVVIDATQNKNIVYGEAIKALRKFRVT